MWLLFVVIDAKSSVMAAAVAPVAVVAVVDVHNNEAKKENPNSKNRVRVAHCASLASFLNCS